MAVRRSRVVGVNSLRRKLRRMDPEITKELRGVVLEGIQAIERDALAFAPVDQGDMRNSIGIKVSRDGLTVMTGPGIKAAEMVRTKSGSPWGQTIKRGKKKGQKFTLSKRSKHDLFQFFKGYWIEFGTKGAKKGFGVKGRSLPPQPARPFMGPAYKANETSISVKVKAAVNKALDRAARG